jgi:hypothetical protein
VRIKDLDADVDYALRGFRRADPQIRRTAHAAALQHGAAAVPGLCQLMAEPDTASSSGAREALFALVARATVPDSSPASRASVRKALEAERDQAESAEVKGYLGWLSGMLE